MSRSLCSGGRFAQGCGIVAAFFMFRFCAFLDISIRRVEKSQECRRITAFRLAQLVCICCTASRPPPACELSRQMTGQSEGLEAGNSPGLTDWPVMAALMSLSTLSE